MFLRGLSYECHDEIVNLARGKGGEREGGGKEAKTLLWCLISVLNEQHGYCQGMAKTALFGEEVLQVLIYSL